MAKYSEISALDAQAIIDAQNPDFSNPLLLDTRDAHSYKESHIEGAMLAHDGLMEALIKQKQFDRPVVVYCYHGNSSKDMAEFLGGIGFKHVFSVKGGYVDWKKLAVA